MEGHISSTLRPIHIATTEKDHRSTDQENRSRAIIGQRSTLMLFFAQNSKCATHADGHECGKVLRNNPGIKCN